MRVYLGKDGRYYFASLENLLPQMLEHGAVLHRQYIQRLPSPLSVGYTLAFQSPERLHGGV